MSCNWVQSKSATKGPLSSHFASVVIGEYLYIHGGRQNAGLKCTPAFNNHVHRLHLPTMEWENLTPKVKNSPALCHHTAYVAKERYMVIVGGWDGEKRSHAFHVLDTETLKVSK